MEFCLVESAESTVTTGVVSRLGSWATGNWWVDKFYDPDFKPDEFRVDFTTEGFDKTCLVPIHMTTQSAA